MVGPLFLGKKGQRQCSIYYVKLRRMTFLNEPRPVFNPHYSNYEQTYKGTASICEAEEFILNNIYIHTYIYM